MDLDYTNALMLADDASRLSEGAGSAAAAGRRRSSSSDDVGGEFDLDVGADEHFCGVRGDASDDEASDEESDTERASAGGGGSARRAAGTRRRASSFLPRGGGASFGVVGGTRSAVYDAESRQVMALFAAELSRPGDEIDLEHAILRKQFTSERATGLASASRASACTSARMPV